VIDILPLDKDHRGMPILPQDLTSQRWTANAISNISFKDTESDQVLKFRAWRKGERPMEYSMTLYLSEDHDSLTQPQIEGLLVHFNDNLPTDFKITSHQQQLDRNGVGKGRLFHIKAGESFHAFCQERTFKLVFSGGKVECITAEAKARLAFQRKRPNNNNSNPAGQPKRDNNPGPNPGAGTKKSRGQ
jgi:hypothetical protein